MKTIAKPTGAKISRSTQIENFQSLPCSATTYEPIRGPRVGPRKGARIYAKPTRPASFGSHKSEMVPSKAQVNVYL